MANKSLKKAQWTTRGPGIFTSEEESSDEEETVLTEIMQTVKIVAEVKEEERRDKARFGLSGQSGRHDRRGGKPKQQSKASSGGVTVEKRGISACFSNPVSRGKSGPGGPQALAVFGAPIKAENIKFAQSAQKSNLNRRAASHQTRFSATGQAVKTGQTNYAHSRPIRNADKDENWRNGRSIQQKNAPASSMTVERCVPNDVPHLFWLQESVGFRFFRSRERVDDQKKNGGRRRNRTAWLPKG